MKKQNNQANPVENKNMKFAEAGVLFVIVLALTVFVGARMARHGANTATNVEVATVSAAPVVAEVVAIETAAEMADAASMPVEQDTPASNDIAVEVAVAVGTTLDVAPPAPVTYNIAEQTYFDGDYRTAANQFNNYTTDHPDNAWGFFMLGLSEWKADDLDAAEEAFIAALDLKPDHIKSLVNYSRVLLAQDRPDEARIQIERALEHAPNDTDANRVFSRLVHDTGDLDGAAAGYQQILQSHADDAWSLNNLGLIRIEQEQFGDALAPLARAVSLNSAIACFQNNLGVALERTGHFSQAAAAYKMALDINPDYTKADESLDRVAVLIGSEAEQDGIDLIAIAAGFMSDRQISPVEPDDSLEQVSPAVAIANDADRQTP